MFQSSKGQRGRSLGKRGHSPLLGIPIIALLIKKSASTEKLLHYRAFPRQTCDPKPNDGNILEATNCGASIDSGSESDSFSLIISFF